MARSTVCDEIGVNLAEHRADGGVVSADPFPRWRKVGGGFVGRADASRHVADARTLSQVAGASLALKIRIHHGQAVHKARRL